MITIPAQIEGVTTRKDKTLKVTIGTQELSTAQTAELISLNQNLCYVAIKPEYFAQSELDKIEELKTDFDNQKTYSQRLRAVLFLNWQQNNEGFKEFLGYYISKMELIINNFKTKLDQ